MRRPNHRTIRAVAGASAAAFGLVAVAGAAGTAGASTHHPAHAASASNQTVSVGVLPIADVAPLYLGIQKGFFSKEHLTVHPQVLAGGAAVASAVVGGTLQFGFGATANLVLAKAQTLPIQFVANGDEAAAKAKTAWSGILVSGSSGITSLSQLAGKTVAANATQGENQLALDTILLKHKVKPATVKVVAIGFPTMPTALGAGQVAAVTEPEPFVSAIEAKGGKLLSPLFEGLQPSTIVAGYFAGTNEIKKDPTLVKRFVAAINKSLDFAQAHPATVRSIIPTYTKITATVAAKMKLPVWGSKLRTGSILYQEKMMKKLGWIKSIIPTKKLIWSGANR